MIILKITIITVLIKVLYIPVIVLLLIFYFLLEGCICLGWYKLFGDKRQPY